MRAANNFRSSSKANYLLYLGKSEFKNYRSYNELYRQYLCQPSKIYKCGPATFLLCPGMPVSQHTRRRECLLINWYVVPWCISKQLVWLYQWCIGYIVGESDLNVLDYKMVYHYFSRHIFQLYHIIYSICINNLLQWLHNAALQLFLAHFIQLIFSLSEWGAWHWLIYWQLSVRQ